MSATLNDMSVADLRDLAKRAEATAAQKEEQQKNSKVTVEMYSYHPKEKKLTLDSWGGDKSKYSDSFVALLSVCTSSSDLVRLGKLLVAIGEKGK